MSNLHFSWAKLEPWRNYGDSLRVRRSKNLRTKFFPEIFPSLTIFSINPPQGVFMKHVFIVLALVISAQASALTLKERKQFADWQEYLKSESSSYIKTFKDKCGYDMPVTMEDKFVTPFMEANTSAPSYCDSPRSVMASMCDDKLSKEAISKKIKAVTCKLGKAEEASFKLNGSTLEFTVGLGASNLDDKAKAWLENNL